MTDAQTSDEPQAAANDYKLQISNGDDREDSKLRLYHKSFLGRIEISNATQGMAYMMEKGDAIKLRDALNDWIDDE